MRGLQRFAEFEESLKLRSQTISSEQFIQILDLLSDRFKLEKVVNCHSCFVYNSVNFCVLPGKEFSFSYNLSNFECDRLTYETKASEIDHILTYSSEEVSIKGFILLLENSLREFLGFPQSQSFIVDREIKKVSAELKTALNIETDYEFEDVINFKLQRLNQAVSKL